MSFKIPALEGYFGGKGGSGTYQQIINIVPPHSTFVVPFLGHCAITRHIRPCNNWYLNDIDKKVFNAWKGFRPENTGLFARNTHFLNWDWRQLFNLNMDRPEVVYYLDPPYPKHSRKSGHEYPNEMSFDCHRELLETLLRFERANILISTYRNDLYDKLLKGWNTISFNSRTRGGTSAVETVYFNFPPPVELHDYSFFGNDYKQRELYKLKKDRLVARFANMTELERNFFMDALDKFQKQRICH